MKAMVLLVIALPAIADEAMQLQAIRDFSRRHQYPQASAAAEACIASYPRSAECHKLAGSAWARVGDSAKARARYEQFLRLAAPNDPSIEKVRTILQMAAEAEPRPPDEAKPPPATKPPADEPRPGPARTRVALTVGGSTTVAVSHLRRIAVQDPTIADATVVDSEHFTLSGKTKGTTTVLVWSESQAQASWDVEVK